MEVILISTLGLLVSAIFLNHAPMHDLKIAMQNAKLREQNERN